MCTLFEFARNGGNLCDSTGHLRANCGLAGSPKTTKFHLTATCLNKKCGTGMVLEQTADGVEPFMEVEASQASCKINGHRVSGPGDRWSCAGCHMCNKMQTKEEI